jgi:hypothetical protein
MRHSNVFDMICKLSFDRRRECYGKLPTFYRSTLFSWVRDTSYNAVLVQLVKWDFPPKISGGKSEITAASPCI